MEHSLYAQARKMTKPNLDSLEECAMTYAVALTDPDWSVQPLVNLITHMSNKWGYDEARIAINSAKDILRMCGANNGP